EAFAGDGFDRRGPDPRLLGQLCCVFPDTRADFQTVGVATATFGPSEGMVIRDEEGTHWSGGPVDGVRRNADLGRRRQRRAERPALQPQHHRRGQSEELTDDGLESSYDLRGARDEE